MVGNQTTRSLSTNAQLYIPGKYEGDIISYTKNTGLIEDALQTVKDQPWILS